MINTKNSSSQFTQNVRKDVIKQFMQDAPKFSKKADDILQEQIEAMNIPNSGFLSLKSFQKTVINIKSVVLAIYQFQTRGVKYSELVYYGLGTNKKIGKREYLKFAAISVLDFVISGKYQNKFVKGGQTKGKRTFTKRL